MILEPLAPVDVALELCDKMGPSLGCTGWAQVMKGLRKPKVLVPALEDVRETLL